MSRYSVRNLLNLSELKDPIKLAALRLLNILFGYMYFKGDYEQGLYLAMRSVQVTLQHGLSGMSAIGFAVYASFFCALGKIEKGSLIARVALSVVEKFHAKEWTGRVMVLTSVANIWNVPPRELTGIFESASQFCFETGDIECAMFARGWLVGTLYCSAEKNLDYVANLCRSWFDQIHQHKQDTLLSTSAPLMQFVANLAGQSESATVLTGAFMDERDVLNHTASTRDTLYIQLVQVHIFKLTLAIFVWDFELARDQLRQFERLKQRTELSQPILLMELFYGGIALLSTDRPEVRKAKRKLRRLQGLSRHAPLLYAGKISLLEAELAAAAGNIHRALKKFHISIAHSHSQLVLHEEALACERMSIFLRKDGKLTEAIYYLNKAKSLYQTWGCVVKVRQLDAFLTSRQTQSGEADLFAPKVDLFRITDSRKKAEITL